MDEAIRLLQARGVEVVGCAANVGKREDLQRLVKLAKDTYGTVDVLVSNAAVNPAAGLILDMPDSAIEKILDVNVKSAILLTKEARPYMSKVSIHPSPFHSHHFMAHVCGGLPLPGLPSCLIHLQRLASPRPRMMHFGQLSPSCFTSVSSIDNFMMMRLARALQGASVIYISSYTAYHPEAPIAM